MTKVSLEKQILQNLLLDDNYTRKVIPYLRPEYFSSLEERIVLGLIQKHFEKYNNLPSKKVLLIESESLKDISKEELDGIETLVDSLGEDSANPQWLLDSTEKFCKDKALYSAILESIAIIDGKDKKLSKDAIPSILSEALALAFDNTVGHDYILNAEERYEFYHNPLERVPFDLEYLNKITKNGIPKKSLTVILAGTGTGKSLAMCHFAGANLMQGLNVLYITLEMSEEKIAERIDANLMDLPIEVIESLEKDSFMSRVTKIAEKTRGRLKIKEYPTSSAHAGHFRALLEELKLKDEFVPDIIYVDYINICSSVRYKGVGGVNSYTIVKSIAEELRGLAVEANVPLVTATQVNRSGMYDTDIDLTNTSESFGLPATADLMFALITTEDLEKMNQIMVKQLKNRYSDLSYYKRFVLGIDRSKMKLYDVEQSAQDNISDSGDADDDDVPMFDKSTFGKRIRSDEFKF